LHVPGGVYYIVLRSNPGRHVFTQASDYADFERFLTSALARCRAFVHAFCWQTDAIHLVVQITDISVGRFVQRLTSQYARNIHKQRGGSGHLFQQRYHAVLIDPDTYLLRLIRHIHLLPVSEGRVAEVEEHRLSSHQCYEGLVRVPWVTRRLALRMLLRSGQRPDKAYAEFMSKPQDPRDAVRFERGSRPDPRVLAPPGFLASLPARPCTPENRASLDQVIDAVVSRMGLERDAVLSKSRQRQLALARALVTWHSIERGIATLAEVARKLHRDPSTLFVAVERYRVLRPELFDIVALSTPADPPAAPVPAAGEVASALNLSEPVRS
jgi:REP element-mobilizing transposase RayT